MKHYLILLLLVLSACGKADFYHAENGQIMLGDSPRYFVGTNFWCASDLAVYDPDRLRNELDSLSAIGIWNLRVVATNENWEGLDIMFDELRKRGMAAVLFLNNAWEWTEDGYMSYLEQATGKPQPHPSIDGYSAYMNTMDEFAKNDKAVELFHEHVKRVVRRYAGEPALFSWQICNEPRPFADDEATKDAFVKYIHGTAALIKKLDRNHMVSTGNEGAMGCEGDYDLCRKINDCDDIDYITIHIWPYNWNWVTRDNVEAGAQQASEKVDVYISQHMQAAEEFGKPLVVEEFGYPRDGFVFGRGTPTTGRDLIYKTVFDRILQSAKLGDKLAGCNFWTWEIDPPQEAQGLNSVFHEDSTVDIIRSTTSAINTIPAL